MSTVIPDSAPRATPPGVFRCDSYGCVDTASRMLVVGVPEGDLLADRHVVLACEPHAEATLGLLANPIFPAVVLRDERMVVTA